MLKNLSKQVYTTYEIAKLLGTTDTSVKRWIRNGLLKAYKTPGGHRRIPRPSLERFIEENSHLPDIPSARDAQTNGTSLGERQTRLLQKVEELTLYLIEQNKQLQTQRENIIAQRKKIATLAEEHSKLNAIFTSAFK